MTKSSGLGWKFYVHGVNLSGDTAAIGRAATPQDTLPSTGIDKEAMERMPGLLDGAIDWTSWFSTAAGAAHLTLRGIPSTDVHLMAHAPDALGAVAMGMVGKQLDYAPTRSAEGALQFNVPAVANGYRAEWGRLLTAGQRTDTAAANGTAYDWGAAVGTTAFGLQLYVQLFSFTGTSVTIKVQSSTDNGGGDAFADITGATTAALSSAPTAVRVATATNVNVERYTRIVTTGTFSSAVFAAMIVRNKAVPLF